MNDPTYACLAVARVWPYLAATALVVGSLVAVRHVGQRAGELPGWSAARVLVVLVALAAAVLVVRAGSELQWRVRLHADRLEFLRGRQRRTLALDSIAQLGWQPVGSTRRGIVSAVTIDDDGGGEWRIPAVMRGGAQLIDRLVAASGREEIETWCEALRLRRRMARVAPRVVAAYALLAGWIAAVAAFVTS